MTIFRGRQKCDNKLCCHLQQQQEGEEEQKEEDEEEEEEEQQQQHEEEEEAEEQHAQIFDKKMCGRMLTSSGMTRISHYALRLRTRRAHEQDQRPHYYT